MQHTAAAEHRQYGTWRALVSLPTRARCCGVHAQPSCNEDRALPLLCRIPRCFTFARAASTRGYHCLSLVCVALTGHYRAEIMLHDGTSHCPEVFATAVLQNIALTGSVHLKPGDPLCIASSASPCDHERHLLLPQPPSRSTAHRFNLARRPRTTAAHVCYQPPFSTASPRDQRCTPPTPSAQSTLCLTLSLWRTPPPLIFLLCFLSPALNFFLRT